MLRSVKEDKRACDANKININVERGWEEVGGWVNGFLARNNHETLAKKFLMTMPGWVFMYVVAPLDPPRRYPPSLETMTVREE